MLFYLLLYNTTICLCPGLRYWRFYRSLVPWRDLTICTIKRDQTWGNRGATVSYPISLDRYHLNIEILSKSIFARFFSYYSAVHVLSTKIVTLKYQFKLVCNCMFNWCIIWCMCFVCIEHLSHRIQQFDSMNIPYTNGLCHHTQYFAWI